MRFALYALAGAAILSGCWQNERVSDGKGRLLPIQIESWDAATSDRGTIHLYVDGKEIPIRVSSGTIPKAVNLFQSDIHIGSDQDPAISWKGDADEFEYLSQAKSAAWIAAVYETQKP